MKRHSKKIAILILFIQKGELGINCFEAANQFGDYVLRTTVSDWQLSSDIKFSRKFESVPNAFGTMTDCKRYWLNEDNLAKAIAIIKSLEASCV